MTDPLSRTIHRAYVGITRRIAFAAVHMKFPEVCDDYYPEPVGDHALRCKGCGWTVHFKQGSPRVDKQTYDY